MLPVCKQRDPCIQLLSRTEQQWAVAYTSRNQRRQRGVNTYAVELPLFLASIIHKLNRTTCGLDPFPTKLLMSHLSSIINIILRIVNLCFSSGDFPASCKSAIISPLIKKTGLDSEILKNYRLVANLSFIKKY